MMGLSECGHAMIVGCGGPDAGKRKLFFHFFFFFKVIKHN